MKDIKGSNFHSYFLLLKVGNLNFKRKFGNKKCLQTPHPSHRREMCTNFKVQICHLLAAKFKVFTDNSGWKQPTLTTKEESLRLYMASDKIDCLIGQAEAIR